MAEYCTQSTPFDVSDIDLFKMTLTIKKGQVINFLCEGCSNRAIQKDESGNLYLLKLEQGELKPYPVTIDELMNKRLYNG